MSWVKDHLLSLLLATLFLVALVGQWLFQYRAEVHDATQHGEPVPGLWSKDLLELGAWRCQGSGASPMGQVTTRMIAWVPRACLSFRLGPARQAPA